MAFLNGIGQRVIDSGQRSFQDRVGGQVDERGNPISGSSFVNDRSQEEMRAMNSGSSSTLRYPDSLGFDPSMQNYVLFQIYETAGDALENRKSSSGSSQSGGDSLASAARTANQQAAAGATAALDTAVTAIRNELGGIFRSGRNQTGAPGEFSRNQARLGFGTQVKSTGIAIGLPLPANIMSSYKMSYEETDFTGIGQMITAGAGLEALLEGNNTAEAQEAIRNLVVGLPMNVVDSLAKIVGMDNLNLKAAGLASRQQAMNKFAEKLFTGMARRQFSFEWEMSPRSFRDAMTIKRIIDTFKKWSHPTISDGGLYLNYPAQFKIGFYHKGKLNDYLFKIAMCGCESVEVSYGGDDLTFFRSGSAEGEPTPPTSVKLKVDFTELELLTRERIEEGF